MAKLHFKYATMNSGKSIDLMRTIYNYEEKGFKALLLKPEVDTKAGEFIESRIGLRRKVDILIGPNDSIFDKLKGNLSGVKTIFIDEAQFLTANQIDQLYIVCKSMDLPAICYGLRTDFTLHAFEGSHRLLELSDVLEELPTLCKCGNIARHVGRKLNGQYEQSGETIVIDGSDNYEYVPLCGVCYLTDVKGVNLEEYKNKLGG